MGNLSTLYGYRDAGESLLVSDPKEVYIFHILPDDSGKSAVWVAQKVPDGHITTVMNAFVIREVLFSDPENFLFSSNLPKLAEQLGWDPKTGRFVVAFQNFVHSLFTEFCCIILVWTLQLPFLVVMK